jgi:hypothetical protein
MKKILSIWFLAFTAFLHAQAFEWIQTPAITFNSSANLIGFPTTCDASGNIYLTGILNNAFIYTDIFGDLFYNKYNDAGLLLFSKTFTGKAQVYDIQADSGGNIYMAIAYIESVSIDNTTISSGSSSSTQELFKFDSNGNLLWHLPMTTFNSTINHFKSIAIDATDAVYICFDNFNTSYVKKLDGNGTVLLSIEQQNVNLISSVSVDNEGNIYTAGGCANSNSKFAGVTVPASFLYNTYVAKYSPTGVYQWVKFVQDITCSEPQVAANSPDQVYFSSALYGAYTFGSLVAEGPVNFGYDIFIAKLNTSGAFQWVKEVPGAGKAFVGKRKFLQVDNTGNVYFAGSTAGTVNWGNSVTTNSTIYQDGLFLKINPSGTVLLAKTAGGAETDRFDGITVNAAGNIFVSGLLRGSSTFDALQHTESNAFLFYPVLAKFNTTNLGSTDFLSKAVTPYPNPTQDYFSIQNTEARHGEIFSLLGQKVAEFDVLGTPISIRDLNQGIYIVKLDNGLSFRLAKQ